MNRAQAEGIMSAMAEVIDESIRNMTSNMVTKADQEKVRIRVLLLRSLDPPRLDRMLIVIRHSIDVILADYSITTLSRSILRS